MYSLFITITCCRPQERALRGEILKFDFGAMMKIKIAVVYKKRKIVFMHWIRKCVVPDHLSWKTSDIIRFV